MPRISNGFKKFQAKLEGVEVDDTSDLCETQRSGISDSERDTVGPVFNTSYVFWDAVVSRMEERPTDPFDGPEPDVDSMGVHLYNLPDCTPESDQPSERYSHRVMQEEFRLADERTILNTDLARRYLRYWGSRNRFVPRNFASGNTCSRTEPVGGEVDGGTETDGEG